ncbi:glycosyltransferase [Reichenbachiella agarivorans]|uniref:Glycosyltransferase n=1 Tax=Reichenbachiella agarivorans TaxID=2979464 RepID=A0ABY6CSZ7_9BACT|nr:glycosyltransferase [Reichenbachiella agarivorans]UXP32969.1 glycosyltransferase [Reichenbachiella agarivorans]
MQTPLVSVICLCYNQASYVRESLQSALEQDYDALQIIVVDDGSTDGSKTVIQEFLKSHPEIPFMDLPHNLGNTTAFNQGLKNATGKYVIDLACDDVMLVDRISKQVAFFESQDDRVGVIYSDAEYIDDKGSFLKSHFKDGKYVAYQGDVYEKLIDTYFIPPPTMMMRKAVLDELGGYDESLAYEDFDFWIRSSRNWQYAYQNETLTKIRLLETSHSSNLYSKGDRKLYSTVLICEKIMKLNRLEGENNALANRLKYELRHAFLMGRKLEVGLLISMLKGLEQKGVVYRLFGILNFGINLKYIRRLVHLIKYR